MFLFSKENLEMLLGTQTVHAVIITTLLTIFVLSMVDDYVGLLLDSWLSLHP